MSSKYAALRSCGQVLPMTRGVALTRGTVLAAQAAFLLLAAGTVGEALAQATVTPEEEYSKYIGKANAIEPQTNFGETVSLRDGSLSIRTTDVELPGTGPTIRITRTFRPNISGRAFEAAGGSFRDWILEVPRIKTITPWTAGGHPNGPYGWQVGSGTNAYKNARCTNFAAPGRISFPTDAARGWNATEWWDGYYLVDDTGNDRTVMSRTDKTLRPDVPLMTTDKWLVGCLPATTSGEPGEGFYALAPDGTKYWFEHLVYTQADTMMKALWSGSPLRNAEAAGTKNGAPTPQIVGDSDQLQRRYAALLVTRVEDRFGNWVTYSYTAGRLTSIDASDGRHVGLINNNGFITSITVGSGPTSRTWSYNYINQPATNWLASVTAPDGSLWQYALGALVEAGPLGGEGSHDPTSSCAGDINDYVSTVQGTVTSPAGSAQMFTLSRNRFGRSYVPKECWGQINGQLDSGYLMYTKEWYAYALTSRTLSGPGMAPATWQYTYAPSASSWYSNCPTPASCASTTWTDVTDPDGNRRRSYFSTKFDETENKLLREEDYSSTGQLLRATDYAYATVPAGASNPYPWPLAIGDDKQRRVNRQTSAQWAPVRLTTITQQGTTFTKTVDLFDPLARPTQVTESSAPAP